MTPSTFNTRHIVLLALTMLAALVAEPAIAQDAGDDGLSRRRTPVVEVFESSRDAVVNISSKEIVTARPMGLDSIFEGFFDFPATPRTRQYTRQSVGSGFVLHPDGYIVTNAHVVAGTVERKVTFADGREFDAEIIALDTGNDLAVLKVEADASLPTLPLGRSDDLMVGETVIAIGNPLGYQHTVTAGVLSALDRNVALNRQLQLEELIQTDASINPGNSGGPLLNVLGELIGVNTAIRGDAQNIGFAIPVDQLRRSLPDLLDVERRYRIVAGMQVDNLDSPKVLSVAPDSPAAQAGVQPGDVIRAVNGRPVGEGIDYYIALLGRGAGERMRLTLERNGRRLDAQVQLARRPAPDGAALAQERFGMEVYPLPDEVARELELPGGSGLLVVNLEPDGPAARLGIARRDVLLAVGRHYVSSTEDLGQLLETVDPGENVAVTVLRVDRRGKVRLSGTLRAR